jgi:hypothetical protein
MLCSQTYSRRIYHVSAKSIVSARNFNTMNSEEQSSAAAKASGNRVSVACLPCRNRHIRCDSQQPTCVRCSSEGRTCQYVKSRRGGLDRAKLAARRRARDGAITGSPSDTSPESRSPLLEMGQGTRAPDKVLSTLPLQHSVWSTEPESSDPEGTGGTPASITDIQLSSVANDFLVQMFYKHFHRCHPCALPHNALHRLYEKTAEQGSLMLLIAVMRFIGSMYSCPELTSQLRDKVAEGFQAARRLTPDPFLAQSHLLYSIALYWSAEKAKAREEIDAGIKIALNLGMNRCQFVTDHGRGNAVLQESFRRTWWQLYCTDAYYAAIKRCPTFPLCEVDADTELPCEEDEYESGVSFARILPPPLFFFPTLVTSSHIVADLLVAYQNCRASSRYRRLKPWTTLTRGSSPLRIRRSRRLLT